MKSLVMKRRGGWIVMSEKAVVDRIVDDEHAVLLVGDDEQELVVPRSTLPAGTEAGGWLRITRDSDGTVVSLTPDPAETEAIRARIADKLAQLRQRGCGPEQ